MTYQVCYWDEATKALKMRDATPQEVAEIDARRAAAPPEVPTQVPMLNAHLVLIRAGKMEQLQALRAALPDQDRQEAEAYFNLAQTCRRDNKWVVQFGPALGYDNAGLDQLFIAAAALVP